MDCHKRGVNICFPSYGNWNKALGARRLSPPSLLTAANALVRVGAVEVDNAYPQRP